MIAVLLAVLVLAIDPIGFDPAALKRAVLLTVAPLLFLAAWRGGNLGRLAAGALGRPLGALALVHAAAFVVGCGFANSLPFLRLVAASGLLFILLLVALKAREDAVDRPFLLGDALVALGFGAALLAIAQRMGFDPLFDNPQRDAVSFFGNTNRAAEFLCLVVPLALAWRGARRGFASVLATVTVPIAVTALLLTNSRGGVIAAAAGAIVVLSGALFGATESRRGIDLALLALGALLPLGIAGADGYRLRSVAESEAPLASPDYEPNRQRLLLADATFDMIAARPLAGHGPGSFRFEFPRYRDPEEARMRTLGGALSSAEDPHNEYLLLAAELGIPAAFAFVLFVLLALNGARGAALWPAGHPIRSITPGYGGAFVALAVVSLFRSTLDHAPVAVAFAALGGALAACRERDDDSKVVPRGAMFLVVHLVAIFAAGIAALGGEVAFGVAERRLREPTPGAALRALDALEFGRTLDSSNLALLQREAVLAEARARVDAQHTSAAVDARKRILALDPQHVASNLRLAARALEAGDDAKARHYLAVAQDALGESGADAAVKRLLEQKEERAAALWLAREAKAGRGSLADLRTAAATAKSSGASTYAIELLRAFLDLRPTDADAAFELGDALTAAGAKDAADAAYLRSHVCRAADALARRDGAAADRAITSARRYGSLFEVEVVAACAAKRKGDAAPFEALARLEREGQLSPWFLAAIRPLADDSEFALELKSLGLAGD
jgi:O-Antigen ligase